MSSRRLLIGTGASLAAGLMPLRPLLAQGAPVAGADKADFLFVQTARQMTYDRASNALTLHEVSPVTLMFSDRPERVAGNMRTADFVPFWSRGTDSFLSNPPNADISIYDADTLREVVATLRAPVLDGSSLRYTIAVLEGEMPASAGETSVFIDMIGMPLSPLSFGGARRRMYRRAFWRR